ncbi:PorT family protein [Flavobacterium sp. MAH-1]|uniref:PorT family protein n=1 Tax=Flavobacterium agri TaxID=2743471 RepID=A0A7Y9C7J2_9FLAO|nr:porin family protein [Flavobacterium agri]NUY81393.1 PorT family protein [Flavobacterium agri]NYA71417.1 PorT family protein [Flavobacterium agri]
MKKLLFIAALLAGSLVQAQGRVKPMVRAGLNIARLTNAEDDRVTDFYVGAGVSFKFSKRYTLQPEINYSRQGGSLYEFDPTYGAYKADIEAQYVGIAVTNKIYIVEGFHFLAGPAIDFKVGDNHDDVEGFDFGIYGGVGYTLPLGLTIEARIKQGFVDIFGSNVNTGDEYDEDYNDDVNDIRLNQVISIGVSYNF